MQNSAHFTQFPPVLSILASILASIFAFTLARYLPAYFLPKCFHICLHRCFNICQHVCLHIYSHICLHICPNICRPFCIYTCLFALVLPQTNIDKAQLQIDAYSCYLCTQLLRYTMKVYLGQNSAALYRIIHTNKVVCF